MLCRGQIAKNERTREDAENHGLIWDGDDEQHIIDHPELTNTAIAEVIGRTYSAVHHRRTLLRKNGLLTEPQGGPHAQ